MAEKQGQYETFHPSEVSAIRMAVIEYRHTDGNEWFIHSMYDDRNEVTEGYLNRRCRKLANRSLDCEWRWRFGLLTLEPSDKCKIFKSE